MKSKKFGPRTIGRYGSSCPPLVAGPTWLESEQVQSDYGQFQRRGLVRHAVSGKLIRVWADIPDTYFSAPATTEKESGYLLAANGEEIIFMPYEDQSQTPAEFRKEVKGAYK